MVLIRNIDHIETGGIKITIVTYFNGSEGWKYGKSTIFKDDFGKKNINCDVWN